MKALEMSEHCISTVSYTHLDVYKRQVGLCEIVAVVQRLGAAGEDDGAALVAEVEILARELQTLQCNSASWVEYPLVPAIRLCSSRQHLSWFHSRDNSKSVSYTHLDVYKRQL